MKQLAAAAIAIVVLAVPALPAEAASVYKCTDATGKTTYSERACPETQTAETLRVRPAPEPDESAAGAAGGKTLDQKIAEATDPVVKAELEIEKQRCELAATQLQRYEDAPYLVQKQADGSERRLSDEEAQAEKDKLRNILKERCQ